MSDGASGDTTVGVTDEEDSQVAIPVHEVPPTSENSNFQQKALLLFSGPRAKDGGLQQCLESHGFSVQAFDIFNGPEFDLTDDAIWDPLHARIMAGEFVSAIISPPCGTFSRLRNIQEGPPPLRGVAGRDRYGLVDLTNKRAEQVRSANLLAIRGIKGFQAVIACGGSALLEQPALIEGEVSMLPLDEAVDLLSQADVRHTVFAQCPFGAHSQKLPSAVTCRLSFGDASTSCTHAHRAWYKEVTGEVVTARHAPTRGVVRYYKSEVEARDAVASGSGGYVSSTLAAYPKLLNRYIAAKVKIASARMRGSRPAAVSTDHRWSIRLGRDKVHMSQPLRGAEPPDLKDQEDRQAIGGLRNAAESVSRLSHLQTFGRRLGIDIQTSLLSNALDATSKGKPNEAWTEVVCNLIATSDKEARAPLEAVQAVRQLIVKHTGHVADTRQAVQDCTTDIDHALTESWRRAALDPDEDVCGWLRTGAPAGLSIAPRTCGIFPIIGDEPSEANEDVYTDFASFANYSGVDDDDEVAVDDIKMRILKGHLKSFDSESELRSYLGGLQPVLSKIGIISKDRAGIMKKRTILDTKVSGLKECSRKVSKSATAACP